MPNFTTFPIPYVDIGAISLAANYSNSLPAAVTAIGSTKTTLLIDQDTTVSTAIVIPATLTLQLKNGALITKSGSGSIDFDGIGLSDPESLVPIFASFAAGDITWTGTAPGRVSSNLWSGGTLTDKIARAVAALAGRDTTIVCYPGELSDRVDITKGLSVHFTAGVYTNTLASIATKASLFTVDNRTRIYGDGKTKTFIKQSANNPRIIYATNVIASGFEGVNYDIEVADICFEGDPALAGSGLSAVVYLGNCHRGTVRNCGFNYVQDFAAYVGAFGTGAVTFVDANVTTGTGNLAITSHGRFTGDPVRLSTTGTLPVAASGVLLNTKSKYYAIRVDANNVKVARTYDLALAGTAITFSSAAGGGTHGFQLNTAEDCQLIDNVVVGARSQMIGGITGRNLIVSRNQFTDIQPEAAAGFAAIIDIEPNTLEDEVAGLEICDNFFDGTNSLMYWNAILLQPGGNTTGVLKGIVANNYIIGGPSYLSNGISIAGCKNVLVANNVIKRSTQSGILASVSRECYFKNNILDSCGSGGTPGMQVAASSLNIFDGNVMTNSTEVADNRIVETEQSWQVNTSGTAVTRLDGPTWIKLFEGLTVTIGGVDYTISSVGSDTSSLVLGVSAGTQSNVTMTSKFCSNKYRGNLVPDGITALNASVIYSSFTDYRKKGTVTINPTSVAANTVASQTFTLTGATAGDSLLLNPPAAGLTAGLLVLQAFVSAANTITVVFQNTTGSPIDEGSASWNYALLR